MEIRSFDGDAAPKIVEGRTIQGYAVVFNRESRIMFDKAKKRYFTEVIKSGAITPDLLQRSDVKALVEHNRERLLARNIKGAGSLTLEIDEYGLKYRFDAPNTQDGEYAVEMIRRGDIFGSSFAYYANEADVSYEKKADGTLLRSVNKIAYIGDVSPVSDPAYFGTDVEVRSLDSFFEEKVDESYKEEIINLRKLSM